MTTKVVVMGLIRTLARLDMPDRVRLASVTGVAALWVVYVVAGKPYGGPPELVQAILWAMVAVTAARIFMLGMMAISIILAIKAGEEI